MQALAFSPSPLVHPVLLLYIGNLEVSGIILSAHPWKWRKLLRRRWYRCGIVALDLIKVWQNIHLGPGISSKVSSSCLMPPLTGLYMYCLRACLSTLRSSRHNRGGRWEAARRRKKHKSMSLSQVQLHHLGSSIVIFCG
jgi:hypothetical protein